MKKDGKGVPYLVAGLFVVFAVCLVVLSSGVFAVVSVSVDDDGSVANVTINNPSLEPIYSYEINFNCSSSCSATDKQYFGAGGNPFGSSKSGNELTVYGSNLGPSGVAMASGLAFSVSYSGTLTPTTSLIVLADTDETNLCLADGGCCGDGIQQTNTEECDDGNAVSGDGCSSTCQIESAAPLDNVSDGTVNGGTTGGGGGSVNVENTNIVANVDQLTAGLVIGQSQTKEFKLTNKGNSAVTFSLRVAGLPESINIEPSSMTLAPGETNSVKVVFADMKRGLFAGNIVVSVGDLVVLAIPVTINVKTANFIYDLIVSLPFKFQYVLLGEKASAEIDFKKIGNAKSPVDVTVYYVIKDFTGRTISEEQESLDIAGDKSYSRQVDTSSLALGKYIFGVEAVYPGAYASSSAQFEVVSKKPINPAIIYSAVLVALIMAVVISIRLNKKKKEIVIKKHRRY